MSWRPEGWQDPYKDFIGWTSLSEAFEAGADIMLEAICQEIEKVENPYEGIDTREDELYYATFQQALQKVLSLLRKKSSN